MVEKMQNAIILDPRASHVIYNMKKGATYAQRVWLKIPYLSLIDYSIEIEEASLKRQGFFLGSK